MSPRVNVTVVEKYGFGNPHKHIQYMMPLPAAIILLPPCIRISHAQRVTSLSLNPHYIYHYFYISFFT